MCCVSVIHTTIPYISSLLSDRLSPGLHGEKANSILREAAKFRISKCACVMLGLAGARRVWFGWALQLCACLWTIPARTAAITISWSHRWVCGWPANLLQAHYRPIAEPACSTVAAPTAMLVTRAPCHAIPLPSPAGGEVCHCGRSAEEVPPRGLTKKPHFLARGSQVLNWRTGAWAPCWPNTRQRSVRTKEKNKENIIHWPFFKRTIWSH